MKTKYWTAKELLEGIAERPAANRRIGGKLRARFIVIADGHVTDCATMRGLENQLSIIYAQAPRVHHNCDNGITINFDAK
jgi:hypothetical protein